MSSTSKRPSLVSPRPEISVHAIGLIENELRGIPRKKWEGQWAAVKTHLLRCEAYLFAKRPMVLARAFGVNSAGYVGLLELLHEVEWKFYVPYRQAMALAGLAAAREGHAKEFERAFLKLNFLRGMRALKGRSDNGKAGGMASGKRRAEKSKKSLILAEYKRHLDAGEPAKDIAGKVASHHGVTAGYVRKIVREVEKRRD